MALCLALAGQPTAAEDEDTSASAYLIFDPDTGEFVTVNDPARAQHDVEIDDAIESLQADTQTGEAQAMSALVYVAAGGALVAMLTAGIMWVRRRAGHSGD